MDNPSAHPVETVCKGGPSPITQAILWRDRSDRGWPNPLYPPAFEADARDWVLRMYGSNRLLLTSTERKPGQTGRPRMGVVGAQAPALLPAQRPSRANPGAAPLPPCGGAGFCTGAARGWVQPPGSALSCSIPRSIPLRRGRGVFEADGAGSVRFHFMKPGASVPGFSLPRQQAAEPREAAIR